MLMPWRQAVELLERQVQALDDYPEVQSRVQQISTRHDATERSAIVSISWENAGLR
jgi:hypothetical protein